MIALLAGIGVGSIAAALIGWFVAISGHRQAWINLLRDDLASFLQQLEALDHAWASLRDARGPAQRRTANDAEKKVRLELVLVKNRIILRLNAKEKLHQQLKFCLQKLAAVSGKFQDQTHISEIIELSRVILKKE